MRHLKLFLSHGLLFVVLISFNNCSENGLESKLLSLESNSSNDSLLPPSFEFDKYSKIKHGEVITIKGSGFGVKKQAPPVLYDKVDHAFEFGKLNTAHSNLTDMSNIPLGIDGDLNAVWATKTSTFFYSTTTDKRTPYSKASYFLEGNNAWVGRPVSYGGNDGWDTPVDEPYLYISWWYKNKYCSTYYWKFSPNQQVGEFLPGEELIIESEDSDKSKGVYIGVDKDGLHNAVLYNHVNTRDLTDKKISGITSKASTIFPDTPRSGGEYGYESPGSKLARIWDEPRGVEGIRSSVALHDFYVSATRDGYESARVYDRLLLPSEKWVHLEYELDTKRGRVRMFEDGRLRGEDSFSPGAIYSGKYSPTIALLGTNAKQLVLQESQISEIYMDNSLKRIVVGTKAQFDELKHYEVQMPMVWTDTEVKFTLNLGSLSTDNQLYAYIIDENGQPINQQGIALCENESCSE